MVTKIIGIGFRARNGKDLLASHLVTSYGFTRVAFADALKEECKTLFGWSEKNKNILAREVLGADDRYLSYPPAGGDDVTLLQWWGQARRNEKKDYWIEKVEKRIREMGIEKAVIPDVRYQNEFQWIRSEGGILVNVNRIMPDGNPYIDHSRSQNHESEKELAGNSDITWDLVANILDGDVFHNTWNNLAEKCSLLTKAI